MKKSIGKRVNSFGRETVLAYTECDCFYCTCTCNCFADYPTQDDYIDQYNYGSEEQMIGSATM